MSINIDINKVTTTIDDHISKITRIINKKKNCLIDLNNLNNKIKKLELLNNNEEISQIKKELEDKEISLNNKIQLLKIKKEELQTLQENKEVQKTVFSTTLAESQEEKKEEIKKIILKIQNIIKPLYNIINPLHNINNIFLITEQILNELDTIDLKDLKDIVYNEITSSLDNKDLICDIIKKGMEEDNEELNKKLDEINKLINEITTNRKNFNNAIFFNLEKKKSYTEAKNISSETYTKIIEIFNNKYIKYYNCKILNNIRQLFEEILDLCHE
jgi:hypothetical protein